ncbi:MAG: HIT family protein [Bacteroidetes bacterium]|nr:HIT family protein [Bacteroidota bacterium]
MPHFISKEEALSRLQMENSNRSCLLCELLKTKSEFTVAEDEETIVFLSRYPRFWGQIIVAAKIHSEKFSELKDKTWKNMNEHALKAARILEKKFSPARCYIASVGSEQNLPMTCPHIHFNIIPVMNLNLKPSEVFTWSNGLFDGTEEEWSNLFSLLKREWGK